MLQVSFNSLCLNFSLLRFRAFGQDRAAPLPSHSALPQGGSNYPERGHFNQLRNGNYLASLSPEEEGWGNVSYFI